VQSQADSKRVDAKFAFKFNIATEKVIARLDGKSLAFLSPSKSPNRFASLGVIQIKTSGLCGC
jgi:hypothetical protein